MLDDQPPASLWSGLVLLSPHPCSCRPRVRGGVLAANERMGQARVLPEEPQSLSDDAGFARQADPRSHRGDAAEDLEDHVGVPRVTGQPGRSPWFENLSARGTHTRTIPGIEALVALMETALSIAVRKEILMRVSVENARAISPFLILQ